MESNPTKLTSVIRPEVKMANKSIDAEKVRVQYRKHPNIFVKYKKDKKCIKPVITGYGSDTESLVQAIVETYAEIQKELEEQGYVVAPLKPSTATSRKGKIGKEDD